MNALNYCNTCGNLLCPITRECPTWECQRALRILRAQQAREARENQRRIRDRFKFRPKRS